jgi:hypothetical protein
MVVKMESEIVRKLGIIDYETEKAYKIEFYENPDAPRTIWLPKTKVSLYKTEGTGYAPLDQSGATIYVLKIPKWLAEKRGLQRDTYFLIHRKDASRVLDIVFPERIATYRLVGRIPQRLSVEALTKYHEKGKAPFYALRERPTTTEEGEGKVIGLVLDGIKRIWEIQPFGVFVVEYEAKRNLNDFYLVDDPHDLEEALGGFLKERYSLSIFSKDKSAVLHLIRKKDGWVMMYEEL